MFVTERRSCEVVGEGRRSCEVLGEGRRKRVCTLSGVVKETEPARMPELVQGGGLKILCVQSLVGSNPTSSSFCFFPVQPNAPSIVLLARLPFSAALERFAWQMCLRRGGGVEKSYTLLCNCVGKEIERNSILHPFFSASPALFGGWTAKSLPKAIHQRIMET